MSGIDSQSIRLSDVSNLKNWKTIWGSKLIFCHHWSYEKYCAVLGYGPKKVLANQFAECFAFDLFDLLILRLGVHCYIPLADSAINWPKLKMEMVDSNDPVFTCFQRDICDWVLRAVMYSPAKVYSIPSQASKMNCFKRIVNVFKCC